MGNTALTATNHFMTNKEITVLERQVSPVVSQASQLSITSTELLTSASELREKIKEVQNQVANDKELLYRPIKDALDEVNSRYAPFEKPLAEALKIVNSKMSAYQTALVAKQRADEAKIAARIGEGKGKLKIETALNQIDALLKPATLEMTGFTQKPTLVITDESLIPREFMTPNEPAILLALKEGKVVPGAEIVIIHIPRSK